MAGESRLVFPGTLLVVCHKMLLGADFPFASSLAVCKGSGLNIEQTNVYGKVMRAADFFFCLVGFFVWFLFCFLICTGWSVKLL